MTGAGSGGCGPLCMHTVPCPRGGSQGQLRGQGKEQEGLAGPHCPAVSPQEATGVRAWCSLPQESQQWGQQRGLATAGREAQDSCQGQDIQLVQMTAPMARNSARLGTEINQVPSVLPSECGRKIHF